jgi:hypothetical protein
MLRLVAIGAALIILQGCNMSESQLNAMRCMDRSGMFKCN